MSRPDQQKHPNFLPHLRIGATLVLAAAPGIAAAQEGTEALNAFESSQHDIATIAEARGWSHRATQDYVARQVAFRNLAIGLSQSLPDDFSSAVNLADPYDTPEIYFKGAIPQQASSAVQASGVDVELIPGTGKTAREWQEQADQIADWLAATGYKSYGVAFDSEHTIDVVVGFTTEPPQLPPAMRADVSVSSFPGEVNVLEANVHGGTQASNPGLATFGWCVETSGGTRGLLTAAHVATKSTYTNPVSGLTETATLQDEYYGEHGEFAWYTTTGPEWPNWYADELNSLRRMDNIKNFWFRNDDTCVYGRSSDDRECDQIYRTSYTGNIDGNVVKRMVLTDTDNTVGGDSGGGWSYSTTAHGVHSGDTYLNGAWRNRYSRTSRVDNALGVDICRSP